MISNNYTYPNDPINQNDLTGKFAYTLVFDLGITGLSTEAVFEYWKAHFAEIFPIRGAEDTLEDGEKMNLNIYGAPAPVYVRGMWSDGFRFETGWNHPDFPGWISFDLEKTKAGSLQLRIHGYVPGASAGSLPGLFIFGTSLSRYRASYVEAFGGQSTGLSRKLEW